MAERTQEQIIDVYLKILKNEYRYPTSSELQTKGKITRSTIRHHFGNITKMHVFMRDNYRKIIDKYVTTSETLFTRKRLDLLKEVAKNGNRFLITTAVSGKSVDLDFYNTLKSYCEIWEAELLIFPVQDVASRAKSSSIYYVPYDLRDEHFIYDDVSLNSNCFLSSIKLSAKHINPLTGLSRIGQRNGSMIFGSPKQALEFVATSPNKARMPHALMTTGSITKPDYNTDKYMSERTSYIAENDHVMGAVIVEIVDDHKFHFRRVQADLDGSFIDFGEKYNSDGTITKVASNLVPGDWHCGVTDENVKRGFVKLAEEIKIDNVIIHDFFDGYCINHYDFEQPLKRALAKESNLHDLKQEIEMGGDDLNLIDSLCSGNVIMVKSNHDERLEKYLWNANYVRDPQNHYLCLDLAKKLLEGVDVLKYAYETYSNVENPNKFIWLQRDEEFQIGGVELGQHGDLGANGSSGSLLGLEKAYGSCVVGHNHGGAILRNVVRVGTSTRLTLGYNKGPSSWTQTFALVYENGATQLINFIGDEYRLGID